MRLTLGKEEIRVHWHYEECEGKRKKGMRTTRCVVSNVLGDGKESVVIASGETTCSKQDQFCYSTGRKLSLERALVGTLLSRTFNKNERRMIWQAYGRMTNASWAEQKLIGGPKECKKCKT